MRASRLLVAVLALALLGLVPFTSSASAATSAADASSARSIPPSEVSPRVKKLTAKIVKRNNGQLIMTGVIRPAKGPVTIQKGTSCNRQTGTCNFKKFRTVKVNNKGRYSLRVSAPNNGSWAWRAVKNAAKSEIWLTCKKRPGADCPIP